jgi:hypothetical protein
MLRIVGILDVRPKSRMFVTGPAALALAMVFVLAVGKGGTTSKWVASVVLVLAIAYVAWGLWPGPRRP